uniref:Retrotransposon gag domain-containing protein n=1 Tax=Tanacetum cinerariifolium TaxID=118510 RepID=A0A6L2LYW6_TANCI|nr:hypothetical protein [Tanacetum cinerariifolium]
MSSSTHSIILYDSNVEDAFSSTKIPNYTPALPNYSPASPRNAFSDPLENLTQNLLAAPAISPFYDDPYMKVMQAYNVELPILAHIAPPPSPIETILNHLDELPFERIKEIDDKIRGLGNGRVIIQQDFNRLETELEEARTQIARLQKKQMGHVDEVVLAHVRISTLEMIIEDIQTAIRKLVAGSVAIALKAQVANMANADNTNRNTEPRKAIVARKLFSRSNSTKDCKVKFATGTLTEEPLSWRNLFAQPIRIEEAYKITWSEFKKLFIKKYCPQTEVKKMEDEFYNLTLKGNDLKTYETRFQELTVLWNVTALKPQTLEEALTITQRLIDQKSVPKGKQQYPRKSILAEGQERSPRSKNSHGLAMSSNNAQFAVTYTSISSNSDRPSWGIPLMNGDKFLEMDLYEEFKGDDKDPEENPEEDPSEEHELEDDNEDPEEDPNEEHEPEGSDETESFEEDETTALIDAFAAGSSLIPLPPTSPANDQAPLVESSAAARAPKSQYDFVDTVEVGQGLIHSPVHDTWTIARVTDKAEDVGYVRALQASECRMMTSIEEVNLRVSYQAQVRRHESKIMPLTRQGTNDAMTPKSIQAMIDRAIQRNSTHTQDDASQSLGGGSRRPVQPLHVCSYTDFMKCQPLNFKGTEGVVGLSQWLEKMESIFHISSCTIDHQVKFATRTLLGVALTWWNGHVRTLGHDAAYAMTWGTLKKKLMKKCGSFDSCKSLSLILI